MKEPRKLYRISIGNPTKLSHFAYTFSTSPDQIMLDAKLSGYETRLRRIIKIEENPDISLTPEETKEMAKLQKRLRRQEHLKYLAEKEERSHVLRY